MDLNTMTQIISTIGFPIFICLYMIKINEKSDELHRDEIDKLRETVENNTVAIVKLLDKLDGDEKNENK